MSRYFFLDGTAATRTPGRNSVDFAFNTGLVISDNEEIGITYLQCFGSIRPTGPIAIDCNLAVMSPCFGCRTVLVQPDLANRNPYYSSPWYVKCAVGVYSSIIVTISSIFADSEADMPQNILLVLHIRAK